MGLHYALKIGLLPSAGRSAMHYRNPAASTRSIKVHGMIVASDGDPSKSGVTHSLLFGRRDADYAGMNYLALGVAPIDSAQEAGVIEYDSVSSADTAAIFEMGVYGNDLYLTTTIMFPDPIILHPGEGLRWLSTVVMADVDIMLYIEEGGIGT